MESKSLTLANIDANEVIEKFLSAFQPMGRLDCSIPGHIVKIFTFEEHFFRIESNLSCTVVFNQSEYDKLVITIIVAGGAHGLFGVTWGAESSMLERMRGFFSQFE
jgi:hypothetical protein